MMATDDALDTRWDLNAEAFFSGRGQEHLTQMREIAPCAYVAFHGVEPAWNFVRHEDIQSALRRPELYSSAIGGTTLQDQHPTEVEHNTSILHVDPPAHTGLRRPFAAAFRRESLASLEPIFKRLAEDLVDEALAVGEIDAVHSLAQPMVSYSLSEALGLPPTLRDYFMRLSVLMLADTPPDPGAVNYENLTLPSRLARLFGGSPSRSMMELLRVVEPTPASLDLPPAAIVNADVLEDLLVILATAGTGMTQNCIVTGVTLLARHATDLTAHRDQLLSCLDLLVEEVLRLACPLYHIRRTVVENHEVHGQTLKSGDKVLLWLYSGNMDGSVFADPDVFIPTRTPNPHLSFGRGGPHYCLGAAMARMEVRATLRALLERADSIELAGEQTWLRSNFVRETAQLPIRLR